MRHRHVELCLEGVHGVSTGNNRRRKGFAHHSATGIIVQHKVVGRLGTIVSHHHRDVFLTKPATLGQFGGRKLYVYSRRRNHVKMHHAEVRRTAIVCVALPCGSCLTDKHAVFISSHAPIGGNTVEACAHYTAHSGGRESHSGSTPHVARHILVVPCRRRGNVVERHSILCLSFMSIHDAKVGAGRYRTRRHRRCVDCRRTAGIGARAAHELHHYKLTWLQHYVAKLYQLVIYARCRRRRAQGVPLQIGRCVAHIGQLHRYRS